MNRLHFQKNVRQYKKINSPRPNVDASQKIKKLPLQKSSTFFPFLSPTQKPSSYSQSNCAQSQLTLQQNWRKGEGEKKRLLTTPIQNKNNHVRTLSESFINLIMVDGKKSKAEKIFSQTLKKVSHYLQSDIKKKNVGKKEVILLNRKENQRNHASSLHFALQNVREEVVSISNMEEPLFILKNGIEKRNVYHLIQKAVNNVKPTLQVRKVRVARSIYQVPFIMRKERQERSAVRWIIENAKRKSRHSGSTFSECLAQVVLEAFTGQGQVREKRDQLHRTAEANRTYLRYRWW